MALLTPEIRRVNRKYSARLVPEPSARKLPGLMEAKPGRMMIKVPMNPTQTAAHRRGPTCSPRTNGDKAVTTRGCTKNIAKASAIGRYFSEAKNRNVASISRQARRLCSQGRAGISPAQPTCRAANGRVRNAPKNSLAQTI